MPTYKVFTKRYVAVLALLGLLVIGGGAAMAFGGGKSAHSQCMDNYKDDSTLSVEDKADLCELETSTNGTSESEGYSDSEGYYDSEGYSEQPKTCLEWRTNYRQQYVQDRSQLSSGYKSWENNGHWEQIPSRGRQRSSGETSPELLCCGWEVRYERERLIARPRNIPTIRLTLPAAITAMFATCVAAVVAANPACAAACVACMPAVDAAWTAWAVSSAWIRS